MEAQVQLLPSSLKPALFYNFINFWSFEYSLLYFSLLIPLHIYIKYFIHILHKTGKYQNIYQQRSE